MQALAIRVVGVPLCRSMPNEFGICQQHCLWRQCQGRAEDAVQRLRDENICKLIDERRGIDGLGKVAVKPGLDYVPGNVR